MNIHNKWKVFAVSNILSYWDGDAAKLFDKLMKSDNDKLPKIFKAYSIDVWEPFEYWDEIDVVDKIVDLAVHAQNIENSDKKGAHNEA